MPRYLRWIAAATAALVAQFAFFIGVGALAVGTGNRQLTGGTGILVTLGATFIPVVVALAINDWLAARYPPEQAPAGREPRRERL